MKILVTGFKPFLSEKLNPSEIISAALPAVLPEVKSLILPVEFAASFSVLKSHIQGQSYDYLIMLGQAAGRSKVSLEKIALNWVQTDHADEAGLVPFPQSISAEKPLALMTRFPVDEVYTELKKQNLEVEISFSAGTYVCNDLYYRVCDNFPELRAVFIHVPLIAEQITTQNPRPYLELDRVKHIIVQLIKNLS